MPKYLLNSFLAGFFAVTFTVSPYAVAANTAASNQKTTSKVETIKNGFRDMKLTSAKTYGEILANIEKKNPQHALVLRNLARTLKDEKLPKMQIQEFKYKGKEAVKLIGESGGQQVVIEYLFNGDEALKINGTVFNQKDMQSAVLFDKKLKTIPTFAKAQKDYKKSVLAKSTTPTFQQWKKLSRAQRAEYFLRFRQLLESAYVVHGTPPFKVVSNSNKSFEQWVYEAMMGIDAAAEDTGAAKRPAESSEDKIKKLTETIGYEGDAKGNPMNGFLGTADNNGPSCFVAGNPLKWVGTNSCPWYGKGGNAGIEEFYKKHPTSQECRDLHKGKNWIACNTISYGFDDNAKPYCIDTADKASFNIATHGDGPCERLSPLKTAEDKMRFVRNILKRGNMEDEGKKLKVVGGNLVTDDKELYEKIFDELQKPLTKYINSANSICETVDNASYQYKREVAPPKGPKKNWKDPAFQDRACDGLMKRSLSVQNLLKFGDGQLPTPAPVGARGCDGIAPVEAIVVVPASNNQCKCVPAAANVTPDHTDRNCQPPASAVAGASSPAIATEEPTGSDSGTNAAVTTDCGSFWNRINPVESACSTSTNEKVGITLLGLGLLCAFHAFGLCESDRKKFEVPKPTDPVPACDPAAGKCPGDKDPETPVDPVDPGTAPRNEPESTDNQNAPIFNPGVIPKGVR